MYTTEIASSISPYHCSRALEKEFAELLRIHVPALCETIDWTMPFVFHYAELGRIRNIYPITPQIVTEKVVELFQHGGKRFLLYIRLEQGSITGGSRPEQTLERTMLRLAFSLPIKTWVIRVIPAISERAGNHSRKNQKAAQCKT